MKRGWDVGDFVVVDFLVVRTSSYRERDRVLVCSSIRKYMMLKK